MVYKLGFEYINYMVKYEALSLGLKANLILKFKNLKIYIDSHLVINLVNEIYVTKDEMLQP